ncbi:uncharacterized protein ACMZJ9_019964 [Mantella aurantiaca]
MDPEILAFELQDDETVKKHPVSLTFPWPNEGRLYIITNQRSKCHFLQDEEGQQSFKKAPRFGKKAEGEEKFFQYGVSTKVFSVTDPTGSEWEVRLLLSPSEISRLFSSFNLIGFFSAYLVSGESRQAFQDLLDGQNATDGAEEICQAIAPFLCLPEGDGECRARLREILSGGIGGSCQGLRGMEAVMVAGGLAALMAAQLAASLGGSDVPDYKGGKTESPEKVKDQIHEMVKMFDVQAEELAISHQGKTEHVVFRNPCPDNWTSGGRKCIQSGETFEFGLCHKILLVSEARSKIQFLQSLQESYDMIAIFHVTAFAERLLTMEKWRKTLEVLLKEGQGKEMIKELSQLAATFVCSHECEAEIFQKHFRQEMTEKCSKVKNVQGGGEAVCVFGLLVAITAALKAKSIADKVIEDVPHGSDEDVDQPVLLEDQASEGSPDSNTFGAPNTQEPGHPKPETIGPNLEGNDHTANEKPKTEEDNSRISRGLADGVEDETVDETGPCRTPSIGAPDIGASSPYPDVVTHLHPIEKPSNDQLDLNPLDSNVKICGPMASPVDVPPAVEPHDLPEIPSKVVPSDTCNGREESDEVNANSLGKSVGHVHVTESGSRTPIDEDSIDVPALSTPTPSNDAEKPINQDPHKIDNGVDESLTSDPQKDPSTQIPQETESDIDPLGPRPDHPSKVDEGAMDTSNRPVAETSFPMLLVILIVALTIVSYVLPPGWAYVLYTVMALIVGAHLFLSRTA